MSEYARIPLTIMKNLKTLFLIFLCFLIGCAWFKTNSSSSQGASLDGATGKIVLAERLKKGGRLLVVPFSAGVGIEANEQCEKISLAIVRGIVDVFEENNVGLRQTTLKDNTDTSNLGQHDGGRFEILFSEDSRKADLIIEGHITDLRQPSQFQKWVLRKKTMRLSVEGRMVDRTTGEMILAFNDTQQSKNSKKSYQELGYLIGKDIGHFIVSGIHQHAP